MKKTGKVLSLVLSLALVASSLTATFASAASSETATVTAPDAYYLSNGGVGAQLKSPNLASASVPVGPLAITSGTLTDHSPVTNLELKEVVLTEGSSIADLSTNKTSGVVDQVYLTLKNKDVSGKITLAARYAGSVVRGTDTDATAVYAQTTLTVNVLKKGTTYIFEGAATGNEPTDIGSIGDALPKLSKTLSDAVYGKVETVGPDTTTAAAKWNLETLDDQYATNPTRVDGSYGITVTGVKHDLDVGEVAKSFKITNKVANTNDPFAQMGTISVLAQKYTGTTPVASTASSDRATAATAVTNTIEAAATQDTISEYKNVTYLYTDAVTSTEHTGAVIVTGCDVDFTAVTENSVEVTSGKVGTITATKPLTIDDGTVSAITASDTVDITKGTIGDITESAAKKVTINGGTTKSVTADAGEVEVKSVSEKIPVTVGDIEALTVKLDSTDNAAVKAGNIKFSDDSAALTLKGTAVSVGKLDADYRTGTLTFDNFKGSVVAPVNTYTEGINSTPKYLTVSVTGDDNNATKAVVTGNPFLNAVTFNNGSLIFDGSVKIGDLGASGAGLLEFAPNALYTTGPITSSIRLTKAFKAGDVAFTAATGAVTDGAFTPIGFTDEVVAVSTTKDAFKVTALTFAGITIQGSNKIPVGTTETYKAINYPEGTELPEGEKIAWTFSGNSDYLVATADENDSTKISVKAVKQDSTFPSLNEGTLTATVVDTYGFADPAFEPATFDVSIGAKPSAYTSDTHGTYNMLIGQTYQFKITSSDGSVPPFVVANDGAKVAPYTKSGNSYLYKVTGAKVGDYGVYVGDKVCILHITDVKTDTTKVTVANGKSYVFKITKGEAASAPYFVVAGQGVVLPVDVRGNDYFYKVTNNGRTGDVGVYVNGPKIAVITFTK